MSLHRAAKPFAVRLASEIRLLHNGLFTSSWAISWNPGNSDRSGSEGFNDEGKDAQSQEP
jgi:hypothetical protein